jgi:hypothetical protein
MQHLTHASMSSLSISNSMNLVVVLAVELKVSEVLLKLYFIISSLFLCFLAKRKSIEL